MRVQFPDLLPLVQKAIFRSDAIIQPRAAQTGKVIIQVMTMLLATPQRTAEKRLVTPTPMIDVPIQWVVLRGMPKREASKMAIALELVAAKPCTASSLVILKPTVRIMRHPPKAVPIPITPPQSSITHSGTAKCAILPPTTSARAKIPINFCPSLLPWLNAKKAAESISSRLNTLRTNDGLARRNIQYRPVIITAHRENHTP